MGVIYDPILDKLRTKDESGGGSNWELAETRVLSAAAIELFDPGSYDAVDFVFTNMASAGEVWIGLSIDTGSTYPATHYSAARNNTSASSTTSGFPKATEVYFRLDNNTTIVTRDGVARLSNLQDASSGSRIEWWINGFISSNCITYDGSGRFETNGTVDKIKIYNKTGATFSGGTIKMYGYIGD